MVRFGLYSRVRHIVIPWAESSLRLLVGCCVVWVLGGEQVVRGDAFTRLRFGAPWLWVTAVLHAHPVHPKNTSPCQHSSAVSGGTQTLPGFGSLSAPICPARLCPREQEHCRRSGRPLESRDSAQCLQEQRRALPARSGQYVAGISGDVPMLCPATCVPAPLFARTWAVHIPPCRDLLQTVLNFSTDYFGLKF